MRDEDHSFSREFEEVYGSVDEIHRRRSRRVSRLLKFSGELQKEHRRWERFLACGHATDFLTVGCIRAVRDFAASKSVTLHTPLMTRAVIDSFHRFDPATRYRDEGRMKPVLKTMLTDRVPNYPIDRPKLASGLPRTWYFTEGPLKEVFEEYPPPSPMDRAVRRAVDEPEWNNSWILWPTLSYSVWYHEWFDSNRVPERPDLVTYTPGPSTECSPTILS